MNEEILRQEEIEAILEEAKKDKYSNPNVLHPNDEKTSIFRLSRETGLILINGNEHIGYKHIIERHCLTSRKPYWKDGKIGQPSKLPLGIAPIQYLGIAGKVFKPENRTEEKNNRPETFDVYKGNYNYRNQLELKIKLVTYKGTGIIHTLYPLIKQKDKILRNLRQGFISKATHNLKYGIQTFEMSYFDETDVERFKIILRSFQYSRIDKWYVQVNNEQGVGQLTTFIKEIPIEYKMEVPVKMTSLDFSDVTWIEKEIKKMIKMVYNF